MKQKLFFLLFTAALCSLYAVEFGIDLSNTTALTGKKHTVNSIQINKAAFFTAFPTGNTGSFFVSAYTRFAGYFPIKSEDKRTILPIAQSFVPGRTEWYGNKTFNGIGINWNAGRTYFGGYSGKVFTGLFDGFKIGVLLPAAHLTFSTAYTGLTYSADAGIRLSAAPNEKRILADSRLVLGLSASFPALIPVHLIGFDIITQYDLTPAESRLHTQYAVPYISGKIGRNFSWKCWNVTQFGQDAEFFYSFAAGTAIQYFKPEWLNTTLKSSLAWAAGDYDGNGRMRVFSPITSQSVLRIVPQFFADIMVISAHAECSPIRDFTADIGYTALMIPHTAKSRTVYSGSEVSSKVSYKIHNDFDVSFLGGVFIPEHIQAEERVRWLTRLSAVIHF